MGFILNSKKGVDYLTLDYEGFRQMMINRLKERLPEYTDYSRTDMGIILIELSAHGLDIISYYKDRQAMECFLETAKERRSVIMHSRMLGYTLDSATPSKFYQIFEKERGEALVINRGDYFKVKTKEAQGESSVVFEVIGGYNGDGVFNPNAFEIPSDATGLEMQNGDYRYKAVVIQGKTIPNEMVGYSDGTANQQFSTTYSPAMDYTATSEFDELVVEVYVEMKENDETVLKQWTRKENFLLSTSTSEDYIFSVDEYGVGVIEFGNGLSGMIPPENAKITCSYRIGGGLSTNVGANTIVEIESGNNLAIIKQTFNPNTAFVLGTDMETIEEAKVKAPASIRTLERAVTARDYADIGLLIDFIQSSQSLYVDNRVWDFITQYPDLADKSYDSLTPEQKKIVDTVLTEGWQDVPMSVEVKDTEGNTSLASTKNRVEVWLLPKNAKATVDTILSYYKNFGEDFGDEQVMADGSLRVDQQTNFDLGSADYVDFETNFTIVTDTYGKDENTRAVTGTLSLYFHVGDGVGYQLLYTPYSGRGLELYEAENNEPIAKATNFELEEGSIYSMSIRCLDGGISVKRDGKEVLNYFGIDTSVTGGAFYFDVLGGYEARLTEFSIGELTIDSTSVFISDENMDYIKSYYEDRRMIGQHVDIYPAKIEYVSPVLRIAYDKENALLSSVSADIRSKLLDLMSLGKRNLNEPLIWSDLVRELTHTETGVRGLNSVVFVEDIEVNGRTVETFRRDLNQKYGVIYVLNETTIEIRVD